MSSLPLPVRVAAGLVVTAVEEVRDLPRTVVGLPITAVSRALQLTMRAQQMVTELAIKGDTALDGARPVEDAPSWARFDDDPAPRGGGRPVEPATRRSTGPGGVGDATAATVPEDTSTEFSALAPTLTNGHGTATTALAPTPAGPGAAAASAPEPALGEARDTASVTPDALPGYETMTLAQVRGKLRALDADQLTELLAWESAHADRPPFVTMLTNRIATVTTQE